MSRSWRKYSMGRLSKYTLVIGSIVVIAVGVVWLGVWWPRPKTPLVVSPSYANGVESELLGIAKITYPADADEALALVEAFRQSCARACAQLPADDRLNSTQSESFCDAAADRLRLYTDPSYEAYRAYAKRLTGRDPDGLKVPNIISDKDRFDRASGRLRLLPLDPESVQVRARFVSGRKAYDGLTAGHYYSPDSGKFFSHLGDDEKDFPKERATIYEVVVPVDIPDSMNPSVRVRLVLGMDFVLDPAKNMWKPWRMGFHDPSGEVRIIVPPWL